MPSIRDFVGQQLRWKRPHLFTNSYELRTGDQVLGTISRSGTFKERTWVETEGQQWLFTRVGFSRKKIVIYSGYSPDNPPATLYPEAELASIQRSWRGNGELIFRDGRSYTWTHPGFWNPTWFWTDLSNIPLITLKRNRWLEIQPSASDLPDLPLLTLLGVYLMVVIQEEAAAATAAVSAGSF